MQLTLHATRRTPHGASRLVQAMSAWSAKTRHAPSRQCSDMRGSMVIRRPCINIEDTPPPAPPRQRAILPSIFTNEREFQIHTVPKNIWAVHGSRPDSLIGSLGLGRFQIESGRVGLGQEVRYFGYLRARTSRARRFSNLTGRFGSP